MSTSIFLSRFWGVYILILALLMLLRPNSFRNMVQQMVSNPATMGVIAILTTISGLILVLFHNLWVMDWTVLITLLCWLTFMKGVAQLFFPEKISAWSGRILVKCNYYTAMVIYFILAIFLLYYGFAFSA